MAFSFSKRLLSLSTPNVPQHVKRFYKKVDVVEHPLSAEIERLSPNERPTLHNLHRAHDKYYAVTLDGRVTKTLY